MKEIKTSCLSCKITSICCLFGVGSYLIHSARSYQRTPKVFTALLGAGTICLGIGEIFDKSPFRNYEEALKKQEAK